MAANKTGLEMQALPDPFSYQPHGLQVSKKQRPPTQSRKTLPFMNDAPSGTRTLDPLIKSQLLYQLS